MKKKVFIGIMFLTCINLNAQDWNTAGNTVFPGDFLGTINNAALSIQTSNIERYRITPFGSFQWFGSNATAFRSMALGDNTTASGENAMGIGSGNHCLI